jgi:tripartite-type tricarboxylate transporter receptor subunit TctC
LREPALGLVAFAPGGAVDNSARAIADRLGMSARTVGKHLERAYQELGVGSRAEAIDRLFPAPRRKQPLAMT